MALSTKGSYALYKGIAEGLSSCDVELESKPIYPSKWFNTNKGKPQVVRYEASPEVLFHYLDIELCQSRWDDTLVASFLIGIINENSKSFSVVLDSDWKTGTKLLGKAKDAMLPTHLLDYVDPKKPLEIPKDVNTSSEADRFALFCALVMMYRKVISYSKNQTYGDQISKRLNEFFLTRILKTTEDEIKKILPFQSEDNLTEGYKKILCAIDMFFFKFSYAPFAYIRIATLPTRYRGCTALTSLFQVVRHLGLSSQELFMFVFTKAVAKDVARLSKVGEGIEDIYGYFPYQLEMGLTTRSPYSVSVNPTLYLWIHTIGVLAGLGRSVNAKYPSGAVDFVSTINSAAAVALHISDTGNWKRMFASSEEIRNQIIAREKKIEELRKKLAAEAAVEDDKDKLPEVTEDKMGERASSVLSELLKNDGLSDKQLERIKTLVKLRKKAGRDTIGAKLFAYYTAKTLNH